jgi:uncharacterized protein
VPPSDALAVDHPVDPAAFLEEAGPFLAEREAEHNLPLGVAASLLIDPERSTGIPYFAVVRRGDRIVGAALMTPPFPVIVSCLDDERAVATLVTDLAASGRQVPGVTAPVEVAREFADAWAAPRGLLALQTLVERIYRIERVRPVVGVPGRARVATPDDRDLLVDWTTAFLREALRRGDDDEARLLVDRALATGTRTFYLWEVDGRPVSYAAAGGPTPSGIRIGPVYTPPAERGHGYGSAVTAATTQAQLDAGRRFVFLFTDLANPTSNKIYQAIGYEPVIDIDQWMFEEAG